MSFAPEMQALSQDLLDACRHHHLSLAVAESCTGGLISELLTAVPGSSDVVDRGFVTYSNAAKTDMLGVPASTLTAFGAVSEETARAMVDGVLRNAPVDLAAAVTGIAGPGGGSADKPVGLVHIAAQRRGTPPVHQRHVFNGDRDSVRLQAAKTVLELIKTLAV